MRRDIGIVNVYPQCTFKPQGVEKKSFVKQMVSYLRFVKVLKSVINKFLIGKKEVQVDTLSLQG